MHHEFIIENPNGEIAPIKLPEMGTGREEEIHPGRTVLVIGSGGREHAIVDALARSPRVQKIYAAPGNPGMARHAVCVPIGVTEIDKLVEFAVNNGVDLTVVGPEASLAAGVTDAFKKAGLKIFGPDRSATRIESSKEFAKELMERHGIPTAAYKAFDNYDEASKYVMSRPLPAVIKYDGLAAGKGVVVASTYEEADAALRDMLLDESFGKGRVVVEDFLSGPEFSFMCAVSGRKVYPLAIAQDHKRAYDGDTGPNTGGMGAYSPVPMITDEVRNEALEKVMQATADALADEGIDYTGILYGGLILTKEGPKVIEFNARFGDPETEVVLPRMESDFYSLVEAAVDRRDFDVKWSDDCCFGVVLAAEGYPGAYKKDIPLGKLSTEGTHYHMGTKSDGEGGYLSAGGRVLMAIGRGATPEEAREAALREVEACDAPGLFHRNDIGHQAVKL